MSKSTAPREPLLDWLTVVALAAVGSRLQEYSALHAECDSQTLLQRKLVAGAAPLYNLLAGLLLWAVARSARKLAPEPWTFCWLLMCMNLFYSAGYFLFSGIAGIGDMAVVVDGWQPAWLWRVGLILLGAPLFLGCIWLALQAFGQRIGGEEPERTRRANKLCFLSYGTSVGVVLIAGLFNPYGLFGLPATAGLMAASCTQLPLLGMTRWSRAERFLKRETEPLEIRRRWSWVATAAVVVVLYAFVLGRTLYF
jgi:hypothetical protein